MLSILGVYNDNRPGERFQNLQNLFRIFSDEIHLTSAYDGGV